MKTMHGARLLGLFEHVAHAAGADADEHLDEVRARDGEERHARLARDRAGEQRLAGAGRADQQRALGNLAAEPRELGRVLQELDDLLQLLARLVDAGDVVEGDLAFLLRQHLRAALAEAHRAASREFFCIWRSTKKAMPRNSRNGSDWYSSICQIDGPSSGLAVIVDVASRSAATSVGSLDRIGAELVAVATACR